MKKILTLLLTVLMFVTMAGVNVMADECDHTNIEWFASVETIFVDGEEKETWGKCKGCGMYDIQTEVGAPCIWVKADEVCNHTKGQLHRNVAATCTEDGNVFYWDCANCPDYKAVRGEGSEVNWVPAAEVVIPAGHQANLDSIVPKKESTCTEEGNVAYIKCDLCDKVLVSKETYEGDELIQSEEWVDLEDTVISKLNHVADTANRVQAQNPTCTEDGHLAYIPCLNCDKFVKVKADWVEIESTVIPADHSINLDNLVEAVAPTCTENGHVAYFTCHDCDKVLVSREIYEGDELIQSEEWVDLEETIIPATGHVADTAHRHSAVDATCAKEGNVAYTPCQNCSSYVKVRNEWLPKEAVVIEKLEHTVVVDEAVAPTCTKTGLTEGSHCSECGEVFVAQKVVDVLDHTPVVDEAVASTTTKKGLTEGSHCSECGEVLVAQNELKMIQKVKISTSTKEVKASKLAKADYTTKAITVKGAMNDVILTQISSDTKAISLNDDGTISIARGLSAGTYNLTVKATSKSSADYKAKSVTKVITVVVK